MSTEGLALALLAVLLVGCTDSHLLPGQPCELAPDGSSGCARSWRRRARMVVDGRGTARVAGS